MNYKIIRHIIGWVMKIEAASMLLPFICALIYREPECAFSFAVSIIACAAFGQLMTIHPPENKTMYAKEGYITVAVSWIVLSLFGAVPFVMSGSIPGYVDALFETVSGFSTTGASILTNVEAMPKSILFWRSLTHWIGGMGVLVFLVAILPLSGGNNLYLLKAESTGPAVSKLVPKVRSTAKLLYEIYIVMTVAETILLLAGGLGIFEALTTAFGTAGTGGFGIRNTSAAEYSPYIQNVITVFMLLFGVNFSIYYLILVRKGKYVLKSDEFKGYFGIVAVSVLLIFINCRGIFANAADALRHISFQVVSIITTTGYSTADFNKWPEFSKAVLVTIMFIGACAGSTGGGIKVYRIMILLKSIVKEIKIGAHPKTTLKIKMDGRPVEHETVRAINVYMAAYITIFVISLLIISLDNFDFTTNFTAITATLNNIGPGLNGVGPMENFSAYSVISKLVMTFDMLVGRLEVFPLLILFSPYTWKK